MPRDLAEFHQLAKDNIASYWKLKNAIGAGGLQEIVAAYVSGLDDWPAAEELVIAARQARDRLKKLNELKVLANKTRSGRSLLEKWAGYARELSDLPESEPIRKEVKRWEKRLGALEDLCDLVRSPCPSERAIVKLAARLQALGGHPDAEPLQERIRQAGLRADCLERLPKECLPASEKEDRLVAEAWNAEVLAQCPEAKKLERRYVAARRRLKQLEKLGSAIAESKLTQEGEALVCQRADELPADYLHQNIVRVGEARKRREAAERLAKAMHAKPASDKAIARLWEEAKKVKLHLEGEVLERCQRADERRQCLARLEKISAALPLDKQDKLRLELWNEPLLEDCADADGLRAAVAKAQARVQAMDELRAAVDAGDLAQVEALSCNPVLAKYPPFLAIKARVDDLTLQIRCVRKAADLLDNDDAEAFVSEFDFKHLRGHVDLYAPYHRKIEETLTHWLSQCQAINKTSLEPVVNPDTRQVTVYWTWPNSHCVSHCRIAISPERNFQAIAEAGGKTTLWDVEDHRRVQGGAALLIYERHVYITVWPAIALGWTELVGAPLHFGPIRIPQSSNT